MQSPLLYKFQATEQHLCPSSELQKEIVFLLMDSVDESAPSAKILVGVSLDARASFQLLSWAVTVAAHPNDTVVALHVLGSFLIDMFTCHQL